MNPEHREFLNLRRLPGSISAEQAAILLGIVETNIPVLVSKGFLCVHLQVLFQRRTRREDSVQQRLKHFLVTLTK